MDYVRVPLADWQGICDAVRAKTGGDEGLLSGQMPGEIEGIQTGGGSFGENTATPNVLNLFYTLENGTAVTGEFTLAEHLPNTETLIFDSGLDEIRGIFYVDADCTYTATGTTPEFSMWGLYMVNPNGLADVQCFGLSTYNVRGFYPMSNGPLLFARASYRIDGGKVYVTAQYNKNENYTPFYRGHRYKWVAW